LIAFRPFYFPAKFAINHHALWGLVVFLCRFFGKPKHKSNRASATAIFTAGVKVKDGASAALFCLYFVCKMSAFVFVLSADMSFLMWYH